MEIITRQEIYYVESVERKTLFYTKGEFYMADKKLYELEERCMNLSEKHKSSYTGL